MITIHLEVPNQEQLVRLIGTNIVLEDLKMNIDWKYSKEKLPDDGDYVAAVRYNWKECCPIRAEIIFGEVESYIDSGGVRVVRVKTCDFIGSESCYWMFPYDGMGDADSIIAWEYCCKFKRPDFLNHNDHCGNEK